MARSLRPLRQVRHRYQENGTAMELLECGHRQPQPYEAVFSRHKAKLGRRLAVNDRRRCRTCQPPHKPEQGSLFPSGPVSD